MQTYVFVCTDQETCRMRKLIVMAKFVNQYKDKKAFSFFHMLENKTKVCMYTDEYVC